MNSTEEISWIDAEIERIESTVLWTLKRKGANVQKSIDDYITILAPVCRLYMDVWGVISIRCLATYRNPIKEASEAPVLITHICSPWRSIALSSLNCGPGSIYISCTETYQLAESYYLASSLVAIRNIGWKPTLKRRRGVWDSPVPALCRTNLGWFRTPVIFRLLFFAICGNVVWRLKVRFFFVRQPLDDII